MSLRMKTRTKVLLCAHCIVGAFGSFSQPFIITQPQNQTNLAGASITFSVTAAGMSPLSYQWRVYTNVSVFADLTGETNSALVLTNVRPTALLYGVVVSDPSGSTNSTPAQLIVFPVNLPATTGNVMAIPGDRQIKVNWQAVPGATSYLVKRASTSTGVATVVANGLTATSFLNTNLGNGANYFYSVVAVSSEGQSAESGRVTASPSAAVLDLLPAGAKLEKLATGFQFTEGPVWSPTNGGQLIFSDVDGNKMYQWMPQGTPVFRSPSNRANGSTLDWQGRLITCEPQAGRVVRTEPDGTVTVLVSQFNGTRFNGPNDVVVKSDGTIWFTDPVDNDNGWNFQPSPALYRFDPATSEIKPLATNFTAASNYPNGLCFSPDESKLYLADSWQHAVFVYDVLGDGAVTNRRLFAQFSAGLPDGIRCDLSGRLFSSAANAGADNGVWVFDAAGALLGKLRTPESVENLCFGGTNQEMLFVTATTSVYAVTRRPDLIVASVNLTPAAFTAGAAVTATVLVKNQGTSSTPLGTNVRVRFTLNSTHIFWSDPLTDPLPAGASVLLTWPNNYWTAQAGSNQLRAEVDVANEIPESNETNNSTVVSFNVAAPGSDSDGDGLDTAGETIAGTDPQNGASSLRILSAQLVSPSEFVLTWGSVSWKRYRVVARTQATEFPWTEVSGDIRATGPTSAWTNALPGTNGLVLYRVLVFSN